MADSITSRLFAMENCSDLRNSVSSHSYTSSVAQNNSSTLNGMETMSLEDGNHPRISLLGLPPEIRNRIYHYLLDTSVVEINVRSCHVDMSTVPNELRYEAYPFPVQLGILYANQQLYHEAKYFFYSTNQFARFTMYSHHSPLPKLMFDLHELRCFPCTVTTASLCKFHAVDLEFAVLKSRQIQLCLIFPYHIIDDLIRFFKSIIDGNSEWGAKHSITLRLNRRLFPDIAGRDESLFLEPWRVLHSMGDAIVDRELVSDQFARELEEDMMRERFDAHAWLREIRAKKEKAAERLRSGDFQNGMMEFDNLINELNTSYEDDVESRGPTLNAIGPAFAKSVNKVRYQLEMNCALANHKCCADPRWLIREDYEDRDSGLYFAQNALDLCDPMDDRTPWDSRYAPKNDTTWYTPLEKAKALYRVGISYMYLRSWKLACAALEKADALNPNDSAIRTALATSRQRIHSRV